MQFDKLNYFQHWIYFPAMHGLYVFNGSGDKVSEWFVDEHNFNIHCLINTLPAAIKLEFEVIVTEWKKYINNKLTKVGLLAR